jgi:hypothetical protein
MDRQVVRPGSIVCKWLTMVDATGVSTADNSGSRITVPESQVARAVTVPLKLRSGDKYPDLGGAAYLRLRLGYDDGLDTPVSPVVQVFARVDDDVWECLPNLDGDDEVELTIDMTNDVADGTYMYTSVDRTAHWWDISGGDEVIVAVKTALSASSGTVTTAFIQGKAC